MSKNYENLEKSQNIDFCKFAIFSFWLANLWKRRLKSPTALRGSFYKDLKKNSGQDETTVLDKELETRSVFELYQRAGDYAAIHCHWPTLAPYFAGGSATPTIITYHYVDRAEHDYYRRNVPGLFPVCVSHRQAELLGEPDLPVVYNGLDMAATPFVANPDDYLAIVGRMIPTKGIAEVPQDGRFAKGFIRDPSGTRVDLSQVGWLTEAVG